MCDDIPGSVMRDVLMCEQERAARGEGVGRNWGRHGQVVCVGHWGGAAFSVPGPQVLAAAAAARCSNHP